MHKLVVTVIKTENNQTIKIMIQIIYYEQAQAERATLRTMEINKIPDRQRIRFVHVAARRMTRLTYEATNEGNDHPC